MEKSCSFFPSVTNLATELCSAGDITALLSGVMLLTVKKSTRFISYVFL